MVYFQSNDFILKRCGLIIVALFPCRRRRLDGG